MARLMGAVAKAGLARATIANHPLTMEVRRSFCSASLL
jgi:hypothetical protein